MLPFSTLVTIVFCLTLIAACKVVVQVSSSQPVQTSTPNWSINKLENEQDKVENRQNDTKTVEVRIGFLVGRQRASNGTRPHARYSTRLGRILTLVFEYALDKVNRNLHDQMIALASGEPSQKQSGFDNNTNHFKYSASTQKLTRIQLKPMVVETFGNERDSVRQTIDLILRQRAHVIVGPAQDTCRLESMIAAVFNVPMVSFHCSQWWFPSALAKDVNDVGDDCNDHNTNNKQPLDSKPNHQEQPGRAGSTFIQTKPPSWKIVGRVIALVRRLLDSNNSYPQQLVLLYFKEQQPWPAKRSSSSSSSNTSSSSNNSGLREAAEQQATTNHADRHEYITPPSFAAHDGDQSGATNDASQYKTIGRLLELKLGQLLANRREQAEANRRARKLSVNRRRPISSSLTVLNWHTTYHYGYMMNPFRRLIRRHLIQAPIRQQQQSAGVDYRFASGDGVQRCDVIGDSAGQSKATPAAGSNRNSSSDGGSILSSLESIYIIVGHYYEHLGLMLALDELGLLAFDGWPAATMTDGDKERPGVVNGAGGGQSSSTKPSDDEPKQQQPQDDEHPQPQQRQGSTTPTTTKPKSRKQRPTIVIGVDIEPHDERDDSVRFLRGLLMDGAAADLATGSGPTIAIGANGNEINQQQRGYADLSSLVSKYNHYIGVIPAKPSKPIELLDEMRQFYNKSTNQGHDFVQQHQQAAHSLEANNGVASSQQPPSETSGHQPSDQATTTKINQTGVHDLNHLTLKMLQFARLPIEAYYLYDSIALIGEYFSDCLRGKDGGKGNGLSIDQCSQGGRVFDWFAHRRYSSYMDELRPDSSRFDSQARAEGSYSLVARRVSIPTARPDDRSREAELQQQQLTEAAVADEEFDIVPVGRFVTCSNQSFEFSVDPTNVDKVWWPFWCNGPPPIVVGEISQRGDVNCSLLVPHLGRAKAGDQSLDRLWADLDPFEDGADGEEGAIRGTLLSRSFVSMCLFVCLIVIIFITLGLIRESAEEGPGSRVGGILYLNCLNRFERSIEQDNSSWFNENDAKNFLQIVHNLLVSPASGGLVNEMEDGNDSGDQDDDNNNSEDHEYKETGARQSGGPVADLEQIATSGPSHLKRPLKRQQQQQRQHAEDEVATKVGIGRRRRPKLRRHQQMASRQQHSPTLLRGLQQQQPPATQAIDLHCHMFPFPSCKFVHWLTALHTLKEMLFKYQSNLVGDGDNTARTLLASRTTLRQSRNAKGRGGGWSASSSSFSLLCLARSRLMFQLPILFERQSFEKNIHGNDNRCCCPAARLASANGERLAGKQQPQRASGQWQPETSASSDLEDATADCWWWPEQQQRRQLRLRNEEPAESKLTHLNRTFFTGRHKGSSTVRLLLNKYKTTNQHLCHLGKLNHPAIVRLVGVTLNTNSLNVTNSDGGKFVQMIIERTERGNLRQELALLNSSQHINPNGCQQFKPILWRLWLLDLMEGLEYLHGNSQIGFHGRLSATTCFITNNWRLKLSGFHVDYMRRSLGPYELKQTNIGGSPTRGFERGNTMNNPMDGEDLFKEAYEPDAYLAPELLELRDKSDKLLSVEAMKLADIYSFAYVAYELLVGQEPWTCLDHYGLVEEKVLAAAAASTNAARRRTKLLAERVKVDSSFRPPIARLDKILPILRRCLDDRADTLEVGESLYGPMAPATTGANAECIDQLGLGLLMDFTQGSGCGGDAKNERIRTSLLNALQASKSLVESCWAHLPRDRPQSVAELRRSLEAAIIRTLSKYSPKSSQAQQSTWFSGPTATTRTRRPGGGSEHSALSFYTRLVEATSRERRQAFEFQKRISSELRLSLLPSGVGSLILARTTNNACRRAVSNFDNVYLCMFRIIMVPRATSKSATSPGESVATSSELCQFELLTSFLAHLDELVGSFRGHIHLWDSQVDSLMRFTICAGDLALNLNAKTTSSDGVAHTRLRHSSTYSHVRLVTTFAFELIDLANRLQGNFEGHLQVRCAIHMGSTVGGLLLVPSSETLQQQQKQYPYHHQSLSCKSSQTAPTRRSLMSLARFVMLGQTMQTLDTLEQTSQPQKIQISSEIRAKLLELPEATRDDDQEFRLRLIPALLRGGVDNELLIHQQQQQSYVMMNRINKIRTRTGDLVTYWLLNGPRVTSSQRLMLPLISDG